MKNIMKTVTKQDWKMWWYLPCVIIVIFGMIGTSVFLQKEGQGQWFGNIMAENDFQIPVIMMYLAIAGFSSVGLMFLQKDRWAFLIQRPVRISSIFWQHTLPPLFIMLTSTIASFFICDIWRSLPGNFPGPHHVETALMSSYMLLYAGIGLFFSIAAIGSISSCSIGRKLLFAAPYFLLLVTLVSSIQSSTFLNFIIVSVFNAIAVISAYLLFQAHGDLARLRFIGKLFFELLTAISLLVAVYSSLIFMNGLFAFANRFYAAGQSADRYVVNLKTNRLTHVQETENNSDDLQYAHMDSLGQRASVQSYGDGGAPIDAPDDFNIRRFQTSSIWLKPQRTTFLDPDRYGYLTTDGSTAFYFDKIDNVYKGYSTKTLTQTSVLDSSGFRNESTPGGLGAAKLKQNNLIFAENTSEYYAGYLCTPSQVSFADFDTLTVVPLFKTPRGEKIVGYYGVTPDEVSNGISFQHPKHVSIYSCVITNRRFIIISGGLKNPKYLSLRCGLPMDKLDFFNQTNKGGYCLWFTTGQNSQTALAFNSHGKLIEHRTVPYRTYTVFNAPSAAFGLVMPNLATLFLKFSSTVDHNQADTDELLVGSLATSLLSCIGMVLIGRRLRWSIPQMALGILASLSIGIYAPIAALEMYEFPALEQCENCGKKRIVTRKTCEHCGAPWSIALTGAEIFETQQLRESDFGSVNTHVQKPETHVSVPISVLRAKPGKAPRLFQTLLWKEARVVFPSVVITALIGITIVILQLMTNRESNKQFFYDTLFTAPIIGFWLAVRVNFSELLVAKDEGWSSLVLRPVTLSQIYWSRLLVGIVAYLISFGIAFGFEIALAHTLSLGSTEYQRMLLVNGLVASLIGIIGLFTGISRLFFLLFIPAGLYCIALFFAPSPRAIFELLALSLALVGLASWGAFVGGHRQIKINRISKVAILANLIVMLTVYIGIVTLVTTYSLKMRPASPFIWAFTYKTPSWLISNGLSDPYSETDFTNKTPNRLRDKTNRPTAIAPERVSDASRAIADDLQSAFLKREGWSEAIELHKRGVRTPEMCLVSDSLALSGAVALFDSFVSPLEPTAPLSHLRLRDELIALAPIALLAGLLSAALSLILSRRQRIEKKKAIEYASLSVFIGLYAPLIQYCVYHLPLVDMCPICGKQRIITRDKCEHCSGPWPQPTRTGTEIFEPLQDEGDYVEGKK